jgi:hypothetical protein
MQTKIYGKLEFEDSCADVKLTNTSFRQVQQWSFIYKYSTSKNKGRMVSYGMLRCVTFVRTDVSEERSASFIRMTRIGELGIKLAITSNRRTLRRNTNGFVTLMKEALSSSETPVLTRATRRYIPEYTILHLSNFSSVEMLSGL